MNYKLGFKILGSVIALVLIGMMWAGYSLLVILAATGGGYVEESEYVDETLKNFLVAGYHLSVNLVACGLAITTMFIIAAIWAPEIVTLKDKMKIALIGARKELRSAGMETSDSP